MMQKDSDLQIVAYNSRGDILCLYGDPAYPLRPHLKSPYRVGEVPVLTSDMSSVQVSVEWLFGDVSNYFKFIDFKKNLKLGLSVVGKPGADLGFFIP